MKKFFLNWVIFVTLSFIWGSSFILMKLGLHRLTPYQVAAIRILTSGLVLSPIAIKSLRKIPKDKLLIVFLSGFIGNLIPAFLFCLAEERIDSALTGTINCLTPIFVIVTGTLFFSLTTSFNKIIGVIIAFSGTALLFMGKSNLHGFKDMIDVGYIVLATILYGFNLNMVHRQLKNIPSLQIVAIALLLNGLLAFIVLAFSGYFNLSFSDKDVLLSTGAAAVLGTFGTAISNIIFYVLIKRAGVVFASLVTYGMPFVAIFWGFVAGEDIGWGQISCLVLILIGVYWANRNRSN